VAKRISQLFPLRTAADIVTEMVTMRDQIRKDVSLFGNVQDPTKALNTAVTGDWGSAVANFKAAFENLAQTFTGPLVEPAIAVMNKVAAAMQAIAGSLSGVDPTVLGVIGGGHSRCACRHHWPAQLAVLPHARAWRHRLRSRRPIWRAYGRPSGQRTSVRLPRQRWPRWKRLLVCSLGRLPPSLRPLVLRVPSRASTTSTKAMRASPELSGSRRSSIAAGACSTPAAR
jgi:hypothetical protein